MYKRILVVTSCTGEKCYKPKDELVQDDFREQELLRRREAELEEFKKPAGEMYTGKQHIALMRGINEYRVKGGRIDVNILSAGYGMLSENVPIVPYEVTFSSMNSIELKYWSQFIGITDDLRQRIIGYDLVFFLLGDRYLQSVDWSELETRNEQKLFFFAGESSKQKILIRPNYYMIAITEKEAKVFHSGLIEIKGFLFTLLLRYIRQEYSLWDSIYQNPSLIREFIICIFNKAKQISLFEPVSDEIQEILSFYTIDVPEHQIAVNYGHDLKYYMPENDDRVDPDYNFIEDKVNRVGDPLDHDVYAHQLHGVPQYDGILISKVNIDSAPQKKRERIHEIGIRKFLRLPDNYVIMGDCGAFSYIDEDEPPYTTEQVLDYYHSLGYDYGVSVDHLIVGPYMEDVAERNRRYELTLRNAHDFIEKYTQYKGKYGYTFTPIGVAQGWNPESFRNAVQKLINMGYEYVALGGLAKEKSFSIYKILKEIAPIIPHKNFKMHLFGVVRDNMEYMRVFHKLGVTSFDSASPLRRAWLGSEHNYYSPKKHYASIRIPEATASSPRVKRQIKEYLGSVYFGTKQNYRILSNFCGILSYYEDKEHLEDEVIFFDEQNDTDILSLMRNQLCIDSNSLMEVIGEYDVFYNKYRKLEEFMLAKLKEYDLQKLTVSSGIQQISEYAKTIGITDKDSKKYQYMFKLLDLFKELERKAINALRDYDKGKLDIETTLCSILEYDEKLGEDREKHAVYYREVLIDQPWKKCHCNICRASGVEVIIFRKNNRNRRRGFHNTHVFYTQINKLKEEIKNELYNKKENGLISTF